MSKHQPEEVRRRQILDAAKQCFIHQGLDSSTMRDIAREANLSLGGIYFHFDSKTEIFRAVCNETYGTVLRKWQQEAGDHTSTADLLRALSLINIDMIETDPDYFRLALVLNAAAVVDKGLQGIKREHHRRFVEFIEKALEKGVERRELRSHDCLGVAESIVAVFDGFYLRRGINADIHPRSSIITALDLLIEVLTA
jgi:AcrR family transcriptional regulator